MRILSGLELNASLNVFEISLPKKTMPLLNDQTGSGQDLQIKPQCHLWSHDPINTMMWRLGSNQTLHAEG